MELRADTTLADELAAEKRAWEALQPGGSAQGAFARLAFLKDHSMLVDSRRSPSPTLAPISISEHLLPRRERSTASSTVR